MAERETDEYVNFRKDKGNDELIDEEVKESFAEDQQLDEGSNQLKDKLQKHTGESPSLSAGDVDAAWDDADKTGEEAVGGMTPTPDQDEVDEVGRAVGITYSDTEPLHTDDKLNKREQDRWELNPASDPEYEERVKEEFTPQPKPTPKRTSKRARKPVSGSKPKRRRKSS